MVCSMVKKGLLAAALSTGALFLVFGTSAPSYVTTAFYKVRQNAKAAVDPQFEIDRARNEIAGLKPMFDQNKETLARAEVEAENLEHEVATTQTNLDRAQKTILSLRNSLQKGDFRLAGHVIDAVNEVKAELAHRLDHFTYSSDLLKQKQETLKAKRKIIQAAREQFDILRTQKLTLLARLANIEAKLKMIETTESKKEFNFDGSALARAKQTVSELEDRLDIMTRKAEIDGRYGELDSSSSYVDPHRDVVKEVNEKFGQSDSHQAAKMSDKSL